MKLGSRKLTTSSSCGCSNQGTSSCSNLKLTKISRLEDKVLVMLSDGSYYEADISVIDENLFAEQTKTFSALVRQMQEELNKVKSGALTKADFVQETHTSFDDSDEMIKTLRFKESK